MKEEKILKNLLLSLNIDKYIKSENNNEVIIAKDDFNFIKCKLGLISEQVKVINGKILNIFDFYISENKLYSINFNGIIIFLDKIKKQNIKDEFVNLIDKYFGIDNNENKLTFAELKTLIIELNLYYENLFNIDYFYEDKEVINCLINYLKDISDDKSPDLIEKINFSEDFENNELNNSFFQLNEEEKKLLNENEVQKTKEKQFEISFLKNSISNLSKKYRNLIETKLYSKEHKELDENIKIRKTILRFVNGNKYFWEKDLAEKSVVSRYKTNILYQKYLDEINIVKTIQENPETNVNLLLENEQLYFSENKVLDKFYKDFKIYKKSSEWSKLNNLDDFKHKIFEILNDNKLLLNIKQEVLEQFKSNLILASSKDSNFNINKISSLLKMEKNKKDNFKHLSLNSGQLREVNTRIKVLETIIKLSKNHKNIKQSLIVKTSGVSETTIRKYLKEFL